ncbi:hypothetical protein V8C35DRAFT_324539 [Trichoderma chlorosporum]
MNSDDGGKAHVVKDIALDGDVIFVVGEKKVALRVHSQFLICASKVFAAMLGPNWSEGRNRTKESPKEIPLTEDDADAMHAICCVIHHRNDILPETFSPRQVLQIAIEADKYDLNIALFHARTQWLQNQNTTNSTEIAYLLAAAFSFHDLKMFKEYSLDLILQHKGSYITLLADPALDLVLPSDIACLLEERRNRMRAELGKMLLDESKYGCNCGVSENKRDTYKKLSRDYGPLKMLEVPISQIIGRIKMRAYQHEPTDYVATLFKKVKAIKKRATICLECEGKSCRLKHKRRRCVK